MLLATLVSLTSCEEETSTYQVRIVSECYQDVLGTGLPFLKVSLDEVKLNGEVVATDIAAPNGDGANYRTTSEYFDVESGIDYEVEVTCTTYFYDAENMEWPATGTTETYTAGTESWSNDESHDTFAMKFTCGGLLQAFRPVFETFYEN